MKYGSAFVPVYRKFHRHENFVSSDETKVSPDETLVSPKENN